MYPINEVLLCAFNTTPHVSGGVICFHVGCPCVDRPSVRTSFTFDNLSIYWQISFKVCICICFKSDLLGIVNGQSSIIYWGGRVVRWYWVNFQCRGVLLIWIRVGQGPTALAVGAGGGCMDIFSLVYHFSLLSPSLWETAWYRLKYCLKVPLSAKQPTNQSIIYYWIMALVNVQKMLFGL